MFKKYQSIENSYQTSHIEFYVNKFGKELLDSTFVITEKLDGANFQINITKDEVKYGRRTDYLKEDEKFFNWNEIKGKYEVIGKHIQQCLNMPKEKQIVVLGHELKISEITLYFEMISNKINKRVKYFHDNNKTELVCIDVVIDNKKLSYFDGITFLQSLGLINIRFAPVFAVVEGLSKALDFPTRFNSGLIELENNLIEGIVIQPLEPEKFRTNEYFILKKKNKEFMEKIKVEKEYINCAEKFLFLDNYINDNRLISAESKFGKFQSTKQIGEFMKEINQDIISDLIKENIEITRDLTKSLNNKVAHFLKQKISS